MPSPAPRQNVGLHSYVRPAAKRGLSSSSAVGRKKRKERKTYVVLPYPETFIQIATRRCLEGKCR
jgi:hypothetical protein